MSVEEKLRSMVTHIENSHLSENEKHDLYVSLSVSLRSAVWPVLVGHMPEDQLKKLAGNISQVTIEEYYDLIKASLTDSTILDELESLMMTMLVAAEKVLRERLIIST